MLRRFFFISSSVAIVSLAFACSSSSNVEVPAAVDSGPPDESDGDTISTDVRAEAQAACVLDPASSTGVAKCDDCLQSKCCQVIADCFSNTDCKALSDCYADCASLGRNDAGVQCVRDCLKQHSKSAQKFQSALECQSSSCAAACKG